MTSQYFLAGNLWLAFAVIVWIGKRVSGSGSGDVSIFNITRYFERYEYNTLLGALVAAGVACLVLHWRSCRYEGE